MVVSAGGVGRCAVCVVVMGVGVGAYGIRGGAGTARAGEGGLCL